MGHAQSLTLVWQFLKLALLFVVLVVGFYRLVGDWVERDEADTVRPVPWRQRQVDTFWLFLVLALGLAFMFGCARWFAR